LKLALDQVASVTETIQVVIDTKLLCATDRAARRTKRTRSALICDAIRGLEERDREGYSKQPPASADVLAWEAEAVWPGGLPYN
jgi:predicted transcriptional regulator